MKEIKFLRENGSKWQEFEKLINSGTNIDADKQAELYIEVTQDLSFARTFYPKSKTTAYLNQLTSKLHRKIYSNKHEDSRRILRFWMIELPEVFISVRKEILISFLIFSVSILIGIVSSANDNTFIRLILGDGYVNMTLENIDKGDPTAVYKSYKQVPMFLGITLNNIFVSFQAFALGLIFSIGTAYVLFQNGVMLGAFHYFFYEQNLFWETWRIIWIHGTLEISSIVIAGAAGIVIGNSFLFPGTYSRLESFKVGAIKGVKIIIGLVPIFIIAGLLESFVTRHSDMPLWINISILSASFAFVIFYFLVYPYILFKYKENLYAGRFFRKLLPNA